jgi:hypothetical protein
MNTISLSKPFLFILSGVVLIASPVFGDADKGIPAVVQGDDDPNIGIKYKANQGLFVTDISAKILGLKMADVEEKTLTKELRLTAQVYDVSPVGKALASAWIPASLTESITPDTAVSAPEKRGARVAQVSTLTTKMNQKAEVLLELDDSGDTLKVGQFLDLTATLPASVDAVVVPRKAVLKTSEGSFAYVDNSGWKMRTPVKVGTEQDGLVEITDGLLSGDSVVTNPVMTLWMTELQLTKSGKA